MKKQVLIVASVALLAVGLITATNLKGSSTEKAKAFADSSGIGYSMPVQNEYYPEPPFNYNDCEFSVVVAQSLGDLSNLVPAPLVPTPLPLPLPFPADVMMLQGQCADTTFGPGGISVVFIPVSLQGQFVGVYSLNGFSDNPEIVTARRETLGCPMVTVDKTERKEKVGSVETKISDNGVQLMKISVPSTMPLDPTMLFGPEGFHFPPTVSLKLIPSLTGGTPDVMKLLWQMLEDKNSTDFTWGGFTKMPEVELGGILAQELVLGGKAGFNMTVDFTAGGAMQLMDYLQMQ